MKKKTPTTVADLLSAYLNHANTEYRTRESANLASSLGKLIRFAGEHPADQFRSRSLQAYRDQLVAGTLSDRELSRPYVNRLIDHVRRCWRWAVSMELVASESLESLRSVSALRKGRTDAPDLDPVRPVTRELIAAVIPHLSPGIKAIVELLRLTGARTGEIRTMRNREIDVTRDVWLYRPAMHKSAAHGHQRITPLDDDAQRVILPLYSPFLLDDYVIASPRGGCYGETAVRNAVQTACRRAGVETWHPHQIRHAVITELANASAGELEIPQLIAGHSHRSTTESYVERGVDRTIAAAERLRAIRNA